MHCSTKAWLSSSSLLHTGSMVPSSGPAENREQFILAMILHLGKQGSVQHGMIGLIPTGESIYILWRPLLNLRRTRLRVAMWSFIKGQLRGSKQCSSTPSSSSTMSGWLDELQHSSQKSCTGTVGSPALISQTTCNTMRLTSSTVTIGYLHDMIFDLTMAIASTLCCILMFVRPSTSTCQSNCSYLRTMTHQSIHPKEEMTWRTMMIG